MLALKNLERVDVDGTEFVPVEEWAWTPEVDNLQELNKIFIEASGNMTTSRKTGSGQMDTGESW